MLECIHISRLPNESKNFVNTILQLVTVIPVPKLNPVYDKSDLACKSIFSPGIYSLCFLRLARLSTRGADASELRASKWSRRQIWALYRPGKARVSQYCDRTMARYRVSESLVNLNHPAQCQSAEQPGECVFTIEGSVHTVMEAVWAWPAWTSVLIRGTKRGIVLTWNEKLCEKNSHMVSFAGKQNARHNMEKLCEKQKQHCWSNVSLLRLLEEIL